MTDATDSPFTPEMVAEWASFGPKLKGKPTPEQQVLAQERKKKCTAMKKRLVEELSDPVWTEKKIEKELDRLVDAAAREAQQAPRPSYLDPPSGTRDFYPADLCQRDWLFGHMRASAKAAGFAEYDAPVLEHVELYERKAGEEIVGQMYAFHDKEGTHVTLRPEMTPTLARLVLQKTNLASGECRLPLPLKWYSIPQCWRFETTQRGRKREHYQWNMDIVGVPGVTAELELLAAACDFFRRLGLGPDVVGIRVNSRAVLEALLNQYGIQKGQKDEEGGEIFTKACVIIDKLDKIGGDAVTELLGDIGVSEVSSKAILSALCAPTIDALAALVNQNSDGEKDSPAIEEVKRLFALAEDYGFADFLQFDASVVRGLAYYTGVVWEAFDRRGELRAIMGGGRYDRLLELYGGEKVQIPCVGFGFGDCVIVELLKECNKLPDFNDAGVAVDYVVCAFDMNLYGTAAKVAASLRANGDTVDLMPTPKKKVEKSFKYADQTGARRMVFVAPDEVSVGKVRVKDLRTKDAVTGEGIQVDCSLDALHTIDDLVRKAAEDAEAAAAEAENAQERRLVNISVKPCDGVEPETLYKKITETVKGEADSNVLWDEACKVDAGQIYASFTINVDADFDEEVMEWIEYMEDEVESCNVTFQAALE